MFHTWTTLNIKGLALSLGLTVSHSQPETTESQTENTHGESVADLEPRNGHFPSSRVPAPGPERNVTLHRPTRHVVASPLIRETLLIVLIEHRRVSENCDGLSDNKGRQFILRAITSTPSRMQTNRQYFLDHGTRRASRLSDSVVVSAGASSRGSNRVRYASGDEKGVELTPCPQRGIRRHEWRLVSRDRYQHASSSDSGRVESDEQLEGDAVHWTRAAPQPHQAARRATRCLRAAVFPQT